MRIDAQALGPAGSKTEAACRPPCLVSDQSRLAGRERLRFQQLVGALGDAELGQRGLGLLEQRSG